MLYLHTDTDTCMHICILTADYTVKPVLSGHSKMKTIYRLMQVKSIAECSKGSILQSIRPLLSYHFTVLSNVCSLMPPASGLGTIFQNKVISVLFRY